MCTALLVVVIQTVLSSRSVSAQTVSPDSWIVYMAEPSDAKEFLELLGRHLPSGHATPQLEPFVRPGSLPEVASGASTRLSHYYTLEIDGPLPVEVVEFPGTRLFENHRYRVERRQESQPDPFIDSQWSLEAIGAARAWELTTGEADVVIAYLDTGVELDHPDLVANLFINHAEDINGNGRFDPWDVGTTVDGVTGDLDGVDQDANGYVDDVCGYDFVDQVTPNLGDWAGRDPVARDEQGHGTYVAGVGSAVRGNGRGVAGVAPGCRLMPLRAFDATGDGEDDDIAAAIIYAAEMGVDVLNMSFGDYYRSPLLADAVRYAADRGVLMVASSGNDGVDDPHYPSGFSEVMSVGALRRDSLLSFFSGFGSHLSLVAPGEEILTTGLGGGYRSLSGTSFAAPHVSGVAALVRSLDRRMSADEIRFAIEYAARDLGSDGWDIDFGSGLLDALRSLRTPAGGELAIESPANDSGVVPGPPIPVIGSVLGVGVSGWELAWGAGNTPLQWTPISSGDRGVLRSRLGMLATSDLPSGEITLSLRVTFTDGTVNERRTTIRVDGTPPVISDLRIEPIWVERREGVLVRCRTDDRSHTVLLIETTDGRRPIVAPEEGRTGLTTEHYWIVRPSEIDGGEIVRIGLTAWNPAELESRRDTIISLRADRATPVTTFRAVSDRLPYGYLFAPDTLGGASGDFLLLNRFVDLAFGRTILYSFDQGRVRAVDSLGNYVPRGIGDSDGDGLQEALLQATGRGIITEQSTPGGSLFSRIEAGDTTTGRFYPGAFLDVDRDGREEVVGFSIDSATRQESVAVWARREGRLVMIGSAPNRTSFPPLNLRNSFGASDLAHGDIDRDGYPEILLGDSDGDVLLFSWVPDVGLVERWRYETDGIDADKILAIADLDGDEIPEIIFGVQPEPGRNDRNEYASPVWTLRGFSFADGWDAQELFLERFAWPRPVGTFRSGVAGGNLDGRAGEELVLVLFPDAFVFTWDLLDRRLVPLWGRGGAMINRPTISVDRETGEAGFWIGDGTEILRYTYDTASLQRPGPPVLDGWSRSDSTVALNWTGVRDAPLYRLYREDPDGPGGSFALIAETAERQFVDSGTDLSGGRLQSGRRYRYLVVAVDTGGTPSLPSNVLTLTPHAPVVPLRIEPLNPSQFLLLLSGPLADRLYRVGALLVLDEGGEERALGSLIARGDSSLLVTLRTPLPGERLRVRLSESFDDASGAPGDTGIVLTVVMPEFPATRNFWLTSASPLAERQIRLRFSRPVDPGTIEIDSIRIEPEGVILSARVDQSNDSLIILDLASDYPLGPFGYTYTITILSLRSLDGEEIPDGPGSVAGFTIAGNRLDDLEVHPQPFSRRAEERLRFTGLPDRGRVEIYTLAGRLLTVLAIERADGALEWDGRDRTGADLPTGVYLYQVIRIDEAGEEVLRGLKKLVLVP